MEYRVLLIGEMEERLNELAFQGLDHRQDILAAGRRMVSRLRQDPLAQGEALYHFSNDEPAHHYIDSAPFDVVREPCRVPNRVHLPPGSHGGVRRIIL